MHSAPSGRTHIGSESDAVVEDPGSLRRHAHHQPGPLRRERVVVLVGTGSHLAPPLACNNQEQQGALFGETVTLGSFQI